MINASSCLTTLIGSLHGSSQEFVYFLKFSNSFQHFLFHVMKVYMQNTSGEIFVDEFGCLGMQCTLSIVRSERDSMIDSIRSHIYYCKWTGWIDSCTPQILRLLWWGWSSKLATMALNQDRSSSLALCASTKVLERRRQTCPFFFHMVHSITQFLHSTLNCFTHVSMSECGEPRKNSSKSLKVVSGTFWLVAGKAEMRSVRS